MKNLNIFTILIIIISTTESCSDKKEVIQPTKPSANFTFEISKNGLVKFNNTSQNVKNFQWEFGDGEKSEDENPIHQYKNPSKYLVKLTVKSSDNLEESTTQSIDALNFDPVSSFSILYIDSTRIQIKNNSKYASKYDWNMGDGLGISLNETNIYKYNRDGSFNISLTSKNEFGESSFTQKVKISNTVDKNLNVKSGVCGSGFFALSIDGEEFCTKFGEYEPSLNSTYDDEDRDDLLKFWSAYFDVQSKNNPEWNRIYFVGTISNLDNIGNYRLDNSAYKLTETSNSYSKRISFVYFQKSNDSSTSVHATKDQFRVTESDFKISKFSKNKISGTYTATIENGTTKKSISGYFEDLILK